MAQAWAPRFRIPAGPRACQDHKLALNSHWESPQGDCPCFPAYGQIQRNEQVAATTGSPMSRRPHVRASWHRDKGGWHEAASCDILRYSWASQEVTPLRKSGLRGLLGQLSH